MSDVIRTAPFNFETWKQYQARIVPEIMAEYGCTREEAASTTSDNGPHADNWWNDSLAAIAAGETPPQWWVNAVSGHGQYTRWEQWLKHHPLIFDRLHKADLSLYHPKSHWPRLL